MAVAFDELLDAAHKLANAAARVTLPHFRTNVAAENKGGQFYDPVTIADRDSESAMRALIRTQFPHHGIAGEEFGSENEDAEYVWLLDPIDGTRAFILGIPLWGTLIGLKRNGVPLLGLMDQPFTGERYWTDAQATWYRGPRGALHRCTTRRCTGVGDACLTASSPDMFDGAAAEGFSRLAAAVRLRRFGGDCYAYCLLASGHIDIVAEAGLKAYDITPLIPIVEKAGGAVQTWNGGTAVNGGDCIACGDPGLMPAVQSALRGTGCTVD